MDEARRAELAAKLASARSALDESVRVAVEAEGLLRGKQAGAGTLGIEWEDLDFVERLGQSKARARPGVPLKKPVAVRTAVSPRGRSRSARPLKPGAR